MNIETITLEDNITYMIVNEKNNYVYLTNVDNPKDFCIRKVVKKDNEEYFETLDSKEEFDKALKMLKEI